MEPRRPRATLVPNANSPRLLLRLLRLVAEGQRRPAALAESLEVEQRTVHYYTQLAEWLGLVEGGPELRLSARGLALVFAEGAEQRQLYREALLSQPLARELIEGRHALPDLDETAARILALEPQMSPRTARRRASALRGLLEPVLRGPPPPPRSGVQLLLPWGAAGATTAPPPPSEQGVGELDLYRRVLVALLDHGELSTPQLRAVLDQGGGRQAALPPLLELCARRGDALRLEDRLIVSRGAILRRELADEAALLALSDPLYRDYLRRLDRASAGLERAAAGQARPEDHQDRQALSRLSARFAAWDRRLFGQRLQPGEAARAVQGLLPGRRLEVIAVAGEAGAPYPEPAGAWLESLLDEDGEPTAAVVAFPSSLGELGVGVAALNLRLQAERASPVAARLPGPLDPRARVHGGLFSPGEAPPRALTDGFSLRLRAMQACPAVGLASALLLAGRRRGRVPRVRLGEGERPRVERAGEASGLLPAMEAVAQAMGQVVTRPVRGGLRDEVLVKLLLDLGIGARVGAALVLDEGLFARLQEDPECRGVYEALLPLEDPWLAWVEG